MICHNDVPHNESRYNIPCTATPLSYSAGIKSIKISDCSLSDDDEWRCRWAIQSRSLLWLAEQGRIVGNPTLTCDDNWDIVQDGTQSEIVGCWFRFKARLSSDYIHFHDLSLTKKMFVGAFGILLMSICVSVFHNCHLNGVVVALLVLHTLYALEIPAGESQYGHLILSI